MLKISALKELQYMLMPLNRYFNDNTFWIHRAMKRREQKNQQKYDIFLVLDFEATCEKDKKIEPQEIIEFPCIKVNAETCEIEDMFHQYVQPKQHPILTTFCTDLTGITQEMIHNQPYFEDVFLNFQNWLVESGAWNSNTKSVFVTCGDWDLKVMLRHQCEQLEIDIPHRMTHWINIKKAYSAATGHYPRGIIDLLRRLELPHTGKLHSGIDDCRNIVTILKAIVSKGIILEKTSS